MSVKFPAFLDLTSRRAVVVGGGPVAAGKIDALLSAGARVTVVAPQIHPEIERANVEIVRREFRDEDLDGAWWVVAAAPPAVNRQVRAAADARRVFVNAVDDPRNATAYLGGVVRRDGVTIAMSTDGRAPALAGLLREALDAFLPREIDAWLKASDDARREWRAHRTPMESRRPQLLAVLNALYASKSQIPNPKSQTPRAQVALVGAGPGDPDLWTQRGIAYLQHADLVLYDALVDAHSLRRYTDAQCFCVGKRAGRESVRQETIHRLMIRAARQGKRVVRLKGGDPFVFGRGAEEALALATAGIPFEVVPGISSAIAAPELAGIPVTHRGSASGFLVLSGHASDAFENGLQAVQANAVSLVVLMGIGSRRELADKLVARGWHADTPAAIVCGASTPDEWIWTGTIAELGANEPPAGVAGVVVIGEVVSVRDALMRDATEEKGIKYGRHR
ncbi:MAG TPA: uroporphyrinogen-III C-methyltransferase [Vicinamibacterales bacterium]|jgi:uroporphyrin-III C-methyltransferase/precorrin-2 dehydrogenase/sirohydrochlorin ferrochelatase